jgi:hypothetical protein
MRTLSRAVAIILLGVAVTTVPGASALASGLASAQPHHPRMPSCHSDSETPAPTPSRAPVPAGFDCCAAGHDVALVGNGFLLHPPALVAAKLYLEAFATAQAAPSNIVSNVDRHGPPALTSLRI